MIGARIRCRRSGNGARVLRARRARSGPSDPDYSAREQSSFVETAVADCARVRVKYSDLMRAGRVAA